MNFIEALNYLYEDVPEARIVHDEYRRYYRYTIAHGKVQIQYKITKNSVWDVCGYPLNEVLVGTYTEVNPDIFILPEIKKL